MAEHNNDQAGSLPKTPHPALKQFDRLIGEWRISGPDVEGTIRYEWMEGGFFLIQHFDLINFGERYTGIEYTGYDEDTATLRSRLMGTDGSRFMYTYGFEGDTMYYWFGEKGADNYSTGTFSADGNTITGQWQWPNPDGTTGGYTYTLQRQ
ncbi:MAG: hypothetical protein JOZ51_23645 [Chloroflexi bacterium]|nr:hypothetical protein [Chloroflexota bacterium]